EDEARPPGSSRQPARDPSALQDGERSHNHEWLDSAARLRAHPQLETLVRRSLLDLSMLRCRLRSDMTYIAAGVPWYVTLFGRDSALSALQLCPWQAS